MDKIKVNVLNKEYEVDRGTSLLEVSKLVSDNFKYDIILAKVDGEHQDINDKIDRDCSVEFFDLTYKDANKMYVNGLIFLLAHAYRKLFNKTVKVNHSLDKGLFIEVEDGMTSEKLEQLKNKMLELVNMNISIEKLTVSRLNAINYYASCKLDEKLKNLKYNTNTFLTLYKLEDSYDYFYSLMPYSTKVLSHFELTLVNEHGFVLRFPTIYVNDKIKEYEHRENIYNLFKKSKEFGKTMGLEYVCDLNERVSNSTIHEIIRIDEIRKNSELLEVAKNIYEDGNKKIVLIAGPSSSGKTTTTNKLSLCLKSFGLNPILISMDDYFLNREDTPLDENGEPDYENITAVDLGLFNDTMSKLLKMDEVVTPTYNFITGKKEFKNKMKLKGNDILLIEGIHALNPEILKDFPKENKCTIYLSALTELNVDRYTRISTTDNRLLRRIVRDNRTRGHSVEDTLKNWSKVRMGEEKYIFPYQDTADYTINTAMIYEIGVLKIYVEPLLYSVDITSEAYGDAKRLINFLRVFLPISPEEIPIDSVLREFIGGGCFKI